MLLVSLLPVPCHNYVPTIGVVSFPAPLGGLGTRLSLREWVERAALAPALLFPVHVHPALRWLARQRGGKPVEETTMAAPDLVQTAGYPVSKRMSAKYVG